LVNNNINNIVVVAVVVVVEQDVTGDWSNTTCAIYQISLLLGYQNQGG